MKQVRATTTHSMASLTARDRLRDSEATRPDSIWRRICVVDPVPAARPDPVGEPHDQAGPQHEHDRREQMVLEPGVVDAPENTIAPVDAPVCRHHRRATGRGRTGGAGRGGVP